MKTDIKVKVDAKDLQEAGNTLGQNILQIKEQWNVLNQLPSKIDEEWACTAWNDLKDNFFSISKQMGEIIKVYEESASDLENAAEAYNRVEKSNETLLDMCLTRDTVIK